MKWYQYTKTQLEKELQTDLQNGLSAAEAGSRLLKYGPNLLPESARESWLDIFIRQFKSPLIYILFLCAGVIFYIGERVDALIVVAVLLFNAVIGTLQEGRSQSTLRSLKKLSEAEATVIRAGVEEVIPEHEAVLGDVLELQEGQKVIADARVIFSSNLSVDEAALTGESGAVPKHEAVLSEDNLPASSQHNMLFKGTSIVMGNGKAVVVGTGVNTEIGKISKALMLPETEIPLQADIRKLAQVIIYCVSAVSIGLFILGILTGREVKEMFAVVVSLAVSMIPEGLPLVLTIILVTGVWRMSKRNALVKKLQAVEALGQAKIIAVDKTGTITKNEMVVKKLFAGGKVLAVSGNGYEPKGHLTLGGKPFEVNADITMAATAASLASRASAIFVERESSFKVSGDPTEAAMAVLGEKLGFAREALLQDYKELAEIAFNYKNKFRAIYYEHKDQVFCAVSGAPEVLLEHAGHYFESGQSRKFSPETKKSFEQALEEFSQSGLRVVAFGFKHLSKNHIPDFSALPETGALKDMVLGGLFAIEDSVRAEAALAIRQAQAAGVRVVMITGDHKITAKAIAKEAGIFSEGDTVLTGNDLTEMPEAELDEKLPAVSVFARVTPEDKMKIIKAYKRAHLIVAMTGDGVNDAPSLVAADLGVAMGRIGTEVAKEAADIVLLDDNLGSIVAAIEEGRAMYKNIQKALLFLFSTSLGEMLTIVLALLLGLPLPVLAVQILWLNLITDPLIGMALALDNKESGLLSKKFSKPPKYFVDKLMVIQMAVMAAVMSVGTLYLFHSYLGGDYGKALTVSLTALAIFQWYNGFNCHSLERSIFSRQIFRNPYLWLAFFGNFGLQILAVHHPFFHRILKTTPLSVGEWAMLIVFCLAIILAEEVRKLVLQLFFKANSPATSATAKTPAIKNI